jgi:Flp pilus assembly protein TadB
MLATIEMQQRQLNQSLEQAAREKFNAYEASYLSLETSYKASLTLNHENERENSGLKVKVAKQAATIVVMGAILGTITILAITWLVIQIKTLGFQGLINPCYRSYCFPLVRF